MTDTLPPLALTNRWPECCLISACLFAHVLWGMHVHALRGQDCHSSPQRRAPGPREELLLLLWALAVLARLLAHLTGKDLYPLAGLTLTFGPGGRAYSPFHSSGCFRRPSLG